MRNKVRLGSLLALLLMAAPAFAQDINVDWDRDYQGPWETYAWVTPKDGAQNPLIHQRIVNTIDYWLTMRGTMLFLGLGTGLGGALVVEGTRRAAGARPSRDREKDVRSWPRSDSSPRSFSTMSFSAEATPRS